jgi:hypothetical protein
MPGFSFEIRTDINFTGSCGCEWMLIMKIPRNRGLSEETKRYGKRLAHDHLTGFERIKAKGLAAV